MKQPMLAAVLTVGLIIMGVVTITSCNKKTEVHEKTASIKYHCPMHPTIVSDKPGDCPICGMRLVPIDKKEAEKDSASNIKTMYRSTMNPKEISDRPGKDSMGMDMVPFQVDANAPASNVPGQAVVSITPKSRQTMGLQLGTVERRPFTRAVHTSAQIVADETRLHHVTVKVNGWVNELYASVTGQEVKKGQPLLSIYSPDLLSAQTEYVTALQALDKLGAGADEDARTGARDLVESARTRLELWDVSHEQIERVQRTHQVEKYVTLYAPMSGVLIERNISAGHSIQADEVLMTIVDLSFVWGDADIYQSDLPYVHVGMPLELSLPYWQDKTFRGKVIFVSPTLDPETRTLRARLEIPNQDLLLRPGMYGDASLQYSLGEKLCIPADAVMFSGRNTYAFRDEGDGHLVPTEIKVGTRGDGWYELLDGLKEGDRIVVSANFLVDSESSLKAAMEGMSRSARGDTSAPAHVN